MRCTTSSQSGPSACKVRHPEEDQSHGNLVVAMLLLCRWKYRPSAYVLFLASKLLSAQQAAAIEIAFLARAHTGLAQLLMH